MTLDLLSDTVYFLGACRSLDRLLRSCEKFPVQRSQIYGLRQIARQEPGRVHDFAIHQRERAERKQENVSERGRFRLQTEIDFWSLVNQLCDSTTDSWSVRRTGLEYAPTGSSRGKYPSKEPVPDEC